MPRTSLRLCATLLLLASNTSFAAHPFFLPASVDPGRISEQLTTHYPTPQSTATLPVHLHRTLNIHQVQFVGDSSRVKPLLIQYAAKLQQQRLTPEALQRYVLLIQDIPGINNVSAKLVPTGRHHAYNLVIHFSQDRTNGRAHINNRGTRWIGPYQGYLNTHINSILRPGDSSGVAAATTTQVRELKYWHAYHDTPLGSDGLRLHLASDYTITQPGFNLKPLSLRGESFRLSASLHYPVLRQLTHSLYLYLGLDMLNDRNKSRALNRTLFNDRIRSARLGAVYEYFDSFGGTHILTLRYSQGLNAFHARRTGSCMLSRPCGHNDYSKFDLTLSTRQPLTHHFSLFLSAKAQYAFHALLSAEQIGIGGPLYGRAYDPSEFVGDSGLLRIAELRYDIPANKPYLQKLQLFVYYDSGKLWNHCRPCFNHHSWKSSYLSHPLFRDITARSAGAGLRASITDELDAQVQADKPLNQDVASQQLACKGARNWRVFFNVSVHA